MLIGKVKMIKVNYQDNNIVNLMSSISKHFNKKHSYNELSYFKEGLDADNVILIVIDGLGFEFLSSQKNLFIKKHLKQKLQVPFIPTTACSNMTFLTGYPPAQHGVVGWKMFLKETGSIFKLYPFLEASSNQSLKDKLPFDKVLKSKSFTTDLNCKTHRINFYKIAKSYFDITFSKKDSSGYKKITSIKNKVKKIIKNNKKNFIHIYFYEYDKAAHNFGYKSKEAKEVLKEIDEEIKKISQTIGEDTKIIVTADHGFLDIKKKNNIYLSKAPELYDCLRTPLFGDSRVVYCNVKPFKTKEFEQILQAKFKDKLDFFKSEDLVKKGVFGKNPCKELYERVGDYTLILKEDYALYDDLSLLKNNVFKGKHGGVSDREFFVPLIVI